MIHPILTLPEIKLVGITARTSNHLESNPATAQIGATWQRFRKEDVQAQLLERRNPGKVFSVYTDYESNEHGTYTYFLGEEVTAFTQGKHPSLATLALPAQRYVKFTSATGPLPGVVIDLWQRIWRMRAEELGGQRAYIADFEVYGVESQNPHHATVDLYLGIK